MENSPTIAASNSLLITIIVLLLSTKEYIKHVFFVRYEWDEKDASWVNGYQVHEYEVELWMIGKLFVVEYDHNK